MSTRTRNGAPGSPRSKRRPAAVPQSPKPDRHLDPDDPVDEASDESFPASDPPSRSPSRPGPPRPAGENPDKP